MTALALSCLFVTGIAENAWQSFLIYKSLKIKGLDNSSQEKI